MHSLRIRGFSAVLLAVGAVAAPSAAIAGDGYWRGSPDRGWGAPRGGYYAPPPRHFYAPPPRAYYGPPPRRFYAPPLAYHYAPPRPRYGRPGVSLNFRF